VTLVFGRGASGVGHPELTEMERRHAGHIMFGRVAEADYTKALVRVAIGDEDDEEGHLLTGWLPLGAARAGGDREWHPPEVGEHVVVLSESGDTPNGIVIPGGFYTSDSTAPGDRAGLWRKSFKDGATIEYDRDAGAFLIDAKSKATLKVGDSTVVMKGGSKITLTVGDCAIEMSNGTLKLSAGGQTVTLSGAGVASSGKIAGQDGLDVQGGSFKHNGTNVGATHKHLGVQTGSGTSGAPMPG
jgi:phage baseplate assembly protein V